MFEIYKNLLSKYIDNFGIVELICNFTVVLGIIVIYLRVIRNFKDAKKQKNNQSKKVISIVETFSMSCFFLICTLLILLNIGRIEMNFDIYFFKYIAIGIYIFGVFINLYGRKCLGKNWGNDVVIYLDHHLVDTGIYSYIRHPLYSSIIWMIYAVGVMYQNILVILLNTIVFIPFMYYRASQEEKELEIVFKDKYIDYKKKVGMLFPKFKMGK